MTETPRVIVASTLLMEFACALYLLKFVVAIYIQPVVNSVSVLL